MHTHAHEDIPTAFSWWCPLIFANAMTCRVHLATGIEAVYVIYPVGGYYRRHIDSLDKVDPYGSGRRCVSFICYLNAPGWTVADGGQLRFYDSTVRDPPPATVHRCHPSSGSAESFWDVLPECGTLVLFDSKRVWHEVLPTQSQRACLVGWFLLHL